MSSKVKRKPTIKELTNVVLELNDRVNYLYSVISELEKAFSLYVEYKKDDDKFRKYIDKKVKEWKKRMNRKKMETLINQIFKEIQTVRAAGQKEYARKQNNAFANFERIANNLDLDKKEVLLVYLLKHIDGICAYVKGHKSQREDVRGRITDVIVYLCLLWGMVEEND